MLLRGNSHSRLIATATGVTGSRMLPYRFAQRSFSTNPLCKSDTTSDREHIEAIEKRIDYMNDSPNHSAAYKCCTSKRFFTYIEELTCSTENITLDLERKDIDRARNHPVVLQRLKEGLPDPVLTRAADIYRVFRIANEKALALRWENFTLTVFAAWGDVSIRARLSQNRPFIFQTANRMMLLYYLRLVERTYARWLN
jgi:hypothetical protein